MAPVRQHRSDSQAPRHTATTSGYTTHHRTAPAGNTTHGKAGAAQHTGVYTQDTMSY